jgi:hypothetical protein
VTKLFRPISDTCYSLIYSSWNYEQGKAKVRLGRIIQHLLKWKFQSYKRGNSWRNSIEEHRRQLAVLISHGRLRKKYWQDSLLPAAWQFGRSAATSELRDTGIELPVDCPWTFDEIMNVDFETWEE